MNGLDDSRVAVFKFADVGRGIFNVFVDLIEDIT